MVENDLLRRIHTTGAEQENNVLYMGDHDPCIFSAASAITATEIF